MKKISSILVMTIFVSFVFFGFSSNSYAASQLSDSMFNEVSYSYKENGGQINIEGVYRGSKNELNRFDISEKNNERIVLHYIENQLVEKVIYNIDTGIVTSTNRDGEITVQNVNDLIIPLERPEDLDGDMNIQVSPGFNWVKTNYSSVWNQFGALYKKSTVTDTTYIQVQFSAGSTVALILSVIDIIITKGGLTSVLKAFAITITGSAIDTAWYGILDAKRYLTEIEVWSQGELGLASEQEIIEVKIDGNWVQAFDGGDPRTYDEMIDIGIYNVYIWNL